MVTRLVQVSYEPNPSNNPGYHPDFWQCGGLRVLRGRGQRRLVTLFASPPPRPGAAKGNGELNEAMTNTTDDGFGGLVPDPIDDAHRMQDVQPELAQEEEVVVPFGRTERLLT